MASVVAWTIRHRLRCLKTCERTAGVMVLEDQAW